MSEIVFGIRLTADGKDLVGAVRVSKEAIDKLSEGTREAGSVARKFNEQQRSLTKTLWAGAKAIGAVALAYKALGVVKDYIRDAALLNARHETMGVVMEVVGRTAGYSRGEMDLYAESVRKAGITMIGAREGVVRMVQANLDLASASKLARAAQDAAVIANINSSEAFARLIYGIQSGQPEVLRTMGINVSFEESYKRLAKQLKVTTEQLTEQEKAQARMNVVLEASTRIAGTYEAAMGTSGKMLNSLARYHEDLKVRLGEVFNEALVIGVDTYTDALRDADTQTQKLARDEALKQWGRDLINAFAMVGDALGGAWDVFAQSVESSAFVVLNSLNAVVQATRVLPMYRLLNWATDDSAGKLDAFTDAFNTRANENLEKRLARPQLRDTAKTFFAQQDADAAARTSTRFFDDALAPPTLPPKPTPRPAASASAALKAEATAYRGLIEAIEQKTAAMRFEVSGADQLSDAQKEALKVMVGLREGHYKITDAHKREVASRLEMMLSVDQELATKKLLREATERDLKQIDIEIEARERREQVVVDFNRAQGNTLKQLGIETELLGLEARLDGAGLLSKADEIRLSGDVALQRETMIGLRQIDLELERATLALGPERTEAVEREIDTLTRLADAQKKALPDALAARNSARVANELSRNTLDEFKTLWSSVESTGKSVFVGVLSDGRTAFEGIGKAIKASVIDLLYQITAKKWLVQIGASVSGSLGMSGAANAAGGLGSGLGLLGNLGGLGGMGQTVADFGNFFGSIGSIAESGASFGVMEALSGFAMANPWTAGAMAVLGVLGASEMFGGGGGPKQQDVWWDVANRGVGNANITSQDPAFYAAAEAFSNQIRANYTAAQISGANLSGIGVTGAPGADPMQLLQQVEAAVIAALAGIQTIAQAEEMLAARRQLEIKLMEAQGDAAGALAAKREDELKALDATLRPLQQMIHAAEDLSTAFTAAQSTASGLATSAAATWKKIAAAAADAMRELTGGELSPLTPEQKYTEAHRLLDQASASTDPLQMAQVPQLAKDFLAASRDFNASSLAYSADFAAVMTMLGQTEAAASAGFGEATALAAAIADATRSNEIVALLGDISTKLSNGGAGNAGTLLAQLVNLTGTQEAIQAAAQAASAAALIEQAADAAAAAAAAAATATAAQIAQVIASAMPQGGSGGVLFGDRAVQEANEEVYAQFGYQDAQSAFEELLSQGGYTPASAAEAVAVGLGVPYKVIPGHASGLDYVPYDDYLMRAHQGESVLSRRDAEAWRNGGAGITSTDLAALREETRGLRADVQRLTTVVHAGDVANVEATERVAQVNENISWRNEVQPRPQ